MPAPEIIHQLVQQFSDNRDAYISGRYNETQLRLEFLNPFFEALGWDMYNSNNYAPQNREVIHEDSIDIEGGTRAPDYCFRLGQTRKFFVEAKKPAVNIKYDIHPAYQLRRYAWNAHLPLSILTDFEELAVYDCR
ncbi:MAG: restriction endonuclease subunit M, partial [Anaerolineaceae bacterium]|nr:restriction endonuclease subunit M [Anaerolineaceae bacterium]